MFAKALPGLFICILLTHSGCERHGGLGEPAYEGCATDENGVVLDDYIQTGRVRTDPGEAPHWVAPAAGATLGSESPPVFRFQPSATIQGTPNGDATCSHFQPASQRGLSLAPQGLSPWHLPPISGTVFDLHLAADGALAYRVLTTRQWASPPAEKWRALAGKRLIAALYSVRLLSNDVVSGPFRAADRVFQVGP